MRIPIWKGFVDHGRAWQRPSSSATGQEPSRSPACRRGRGDLDHGGGEDPVHLRYASVHHPGRAGDLPDLQYGVDSLKPGTGGRLGASARSNNWHRDGPDLCSR